MKFLKHTFLLVLFLLANAPLYSQQYIGKKKDINKILKNIENFSKYYMNGDHEKIAASYTDDGKIFPTGTPIIEGPEALEKYWTLPSTTKILKHKVTPTEIRIVKRIAYDYGYYEGETLTAKGEKIPWKGKYVIIWKKIGKDWKIYLDIWNKVEIQN